MKSSYECLLIWIMHMARSKDGLKWDFAYLSTLLASSGSQKAGDDGNSCVQLRIHGTQAGYGDGMGCIRSSE